MAKDRTSIGGLSAWGLSPSALTRLGNRLVGVSIQQNGPKIATLLPHSPGKRLEKTSAFLGRGLKRIEKLCPAGVLVARGDMAWTIDGDVPAKSVVGLSQLSNVAMLSVQNIEGRSRPKVVDRRREWYSVRIQYVVQVEGMVRGNQLVEDRILLLKAGSIREVERKIEKGRKSYEEPYLNGDGYLVRLVQDEIVEIYCVNEEQVDEDGTEVFSELCRRRMKPEYEWHPRGVPGDG